MNAVRSGRGIALAVPTSSTTASTPAPTSTSATTQPPPESRWRAMSEAPIAGRKPGVAVWTGTELVIWGGVTDFSDGCVVPEGGEGLCGSPAVFDGAAYDRATDSWRRIADGPVPAGGAPDCRRCPAACGPAPRSWSGAVTASRSPPPTTRPRTPGAELPAGPLRGRQDFALSWTGTEVVVVGGSAAGPSDGDQLRPGDALADAAALDPTTGQWRSLPDLPVAGRVTAVADDGAVVVAARGEAPTVHRLDPDTETWRSSAAAPLAPFAEPVGVAGDRWLFATCPYDAPAGAAAVDLATLAWEPLVDPPPAVCGTGREVNGRLVTVAAPPWSATAWDPATGGFDAIDEPPDPSRCGATVVAAGTSLLVWSGFECEPDVGYLGWTYAATGARLDP